MPPSEPKPRSAWRSVLKGLVVVAIICALIGTAAVLATRSVYFVGTSDEGFVTVYRGLPYDLAGGFSTYSEVYESGVSVDSLPENLRQTIVKHEVRAQEDATDLVRQLEQGKIAGQQ